MTQHQAEPQNRRSGTARIIIVVVLILLLLLLCWFLRPTLMEWFVSGEATPEQVAVEPTEELPEVEETAEVEPTEEAVQVMVPTINLPEGDVPAGEVALSGTGQPNSQVEIAIDGQTAGTTPVNSDGTWGLTVNLPEPGDYELRARAVADDGAVVAESEPVTLSVTAAEAEVVVPTVNLPGGDVPAGEVTLTGTGQPETELQITVEGQGAGTAPIDSDGNWRLTTDLPEPGEYEIRAQARGEEDTVLAESEPVTLTVVAAEPGEQPPSEPEEFSLTEGDAYVVQRDDWLSKLADRYYGDMFAYPVIVEATNAKAAQDDSFEVIANPDRIEIGQKLWIPDEDTISREN